MTALIASAAQRIGRNVAVCSLQASQQSSPTLFAFRGILFHNLFHNLADCALERFLVHIRAKATRSLDELRVLIWLSLFRRFRLFDIGAIVALPWRCSRER
jgi:hypothetical protein